ncbi:P27 family phage terminase small subunit [Niallia sp. RD1]|uniref:P27 family phage terminase small subunit n=1 Tax=Niallia sp. RD1 TaxID=2962858 RepID=UPI0020C19256|nr:P27 family phage terminase small subunit [Niallia sp. RD1]UTI42111.1 P27 family phage terminase small subunit [Niallia sp. RD1]
MTKVPSKETIKRRTIKDMKGLQVYKIEYSRLIDIYSELVFQYLTISKEFEDSGYEYQVNTDQGGAKKSPIVATLETLRKDILAYSDRLCLNPKSKMEKNNDKGKPTQSRLAAVLSNLE